MYELVKEPPEHDFGGIILTGREQLVLYIICSSKPQYPTYREILKRLNLIVPSRDGGKTKYSSTQQVVRVIDKLRLKGLLVNPEIERELLNTARNIIPTNLGEELAPQIEAILRTLPAPL
nr:hypothetical protein [Anaerolineae bacterium]